MRSDEDAVFDRDPCRYEDERFDLDPAAKHSSALDLDKRGDLGLGSDLAAVRFTSSGWKTTTSLPSSTSDAIKSRRPRVGGSTAWVHAMEPSAERQWTGVEGRAANGP